MIRFAVHVTPRAGADAIDGVRDHTLRVRVRAVPAGGIATASAVRLLARALRVPSSAVAVVAGQTTRRKVVAVDDALGPRLAELWPELKG